jgi:polyphosphate kinase
MSGRGAHVNRVDTFDVLRRAAASAAPGEVVLEPSSLVNMELSTLAFNRRVLELASDPRVPLLERVRFLSILGSNLDEFFMTRVAGFQRQVAMGNRKLTLDGLSPDEQLRLIGEAARDLLRRTYSAALPAVLEALAGADLEILGWSDLSVEEARYLRAHYTAQLDAAIIPVEVPRGGPFPHVRNLRLAFLACFRERDQPDERMVVVELPNDVPRLVPLPGGRRFLPLEEVIRTNLPRLLQGREMVDAHLFRVTRSGNLSLDTQNVEDVLEAVAENVAQRPFQPVVRLEVEQGMSLRREAQLLAHLQEEAENRLSALGPDDVYRVDGLIDLNRLQEIAALPIGALRYPARHRSSPLPRRPGIFSQLDRCDVLVRFPTHSFEKTVERFVQEAASDPAVESIRITLYRTSHGSRIVRLLRRAHANGKQVLALIEVKASFDERRNIEWARTLESVGIRVLYGPPTLKVHAKIASVARRQESGLRLYSYVGTGNLNAATAAAYTDLGLLTADQEIGREVDQLFAPPAWDGSHEEYERLIVAPFNMRQGFLSLIEREIDHARTGRGGAMTIKLNGIADRQVIEALYRAARAGVRIDLIVRGICALRPGVAGTSPGIRVVAIAGRYLEHSRIFHFANAGDGEYYIGSADWRGRNLSRRVEVVVPIEDPAHRQLLGEILREDLENPCAWDMQPDGTYVRRGGGSPPASGSDSSAGVEC